MWSNKSISSVDWRDSVKRIMDSFETSWPSPPGGIETLSNDGIQMDLVSDLQESFEPLQRARYVQLNYFKQITFEWIDSIDERINSFEDFFFFSDRTRGHCLDQKTTPNQKIPVATNAATNSWQTVSTFKLLVHSKSRPTLDLKSCKSTRTNSLYEKKS